MEHRIRIGATAAVVVLGVVAAACGGLTAPPPADEAPAAPSVPATASGAPGGSIGSGPSTDHGSATGPSPTRMEATMAPEFRLTSPAFGEGEPISREYTCDGADVSPPLAWTEAPPGTAALVLIVDDPDARGFVHWVVVDLPGTSAGSLPRGASRTPAVPQEGRNDFGRVGWGGPCPPSGRHRYVFTLYALSAPLRLPGAPDAATVRRAMEGRILGTARLTGTYRRG